MVCRVNAGCPEPFRDCNDWLMMNVYYLINTWGTNLKCVINGDTNYYYIHISDKFEIILHCVIYFEKSFRIWKQVSVLSSANFNLCHYYFLSHTQLHFHILTLPEDTLSLFFFFYKKFLIALTTLLTTRLLLVLNGDGGSFAKFLFFFAEKLFLGSLFPTKLKSNSVSQNCLIFIYFVSMFSTHFQFMFKFFVPDKFNLRENRKVSSDSGQLLIYKSGCKLVLNFEHNNLGQGSKWLFS